MTVGGWNPQVSYWELSCILKSYSVIEMKEIQLRLPSLTVLFQYREWNYFSVTICIRSSSWRPSHMLVLRQSCSGGWVVRGLCGVCRDFQNLWKVDIHSGNLVLPSVSATPTFRAFNYFSVLLPRPKQLLREHVFLPFSLPLHLPAPPSSLPELLLRARRSSWELWKQQRTDRTPSFTV